MQNQLNRGTSRRLLYIENKTRGRSGGDARIGYATFSKTGLTVYYRDRELARIKGGGSAGNYSDVETGEEFWISGVKKEGSNVHWAEVTHVEIDDDAKAEYQQLRAQAVPRRGTHE